MRGLALSDHAFAEGQDHSVLGTTPARDHVDGQLKLFGNRKRDADLAGADRGDGKTVKEELQLT